jgi:hypothetical protein
MPRAINPAMKPPNNAPRIKPKPGYRKLTIMVAMKPNSAPKPILAKNSPIKIAYEKTEIKRFSSQHSFKSTV